MFYFIVIDVDHPECFALDEYSTEKGVLIWVE